MIRTRSPIRWPQVGHCFRTSHDLIFLNISAEFGLFSDWESESEQAPTVCLGVGHG